MKDQVKLGKEKQDHTYVSYVFLMVFTVGNPAKFTMKILESAENYLETILMLQKSKGYARSIDVANKLNFSKPSVSVAMKNLRENGYITVENEGHLVLTEKGLEIANKMYERHQLLSRWLIYMGVSEETALEDACRMEHVISVESFDAMKRHFAAVQELLPKNR